VLAIDNTGFLSLLAQIIFIMMGLKYDFEKIL